MGCISSKPAGPERRRGDDSMKPAKSLDPPQTRTSVKAQAHAKVMEVLRPSSRCGGSRPGWGFHGGGGGGDGGGWGGGGGDGGGGG
jgi:hypothetical protein